MKKEREGNMGEEVWREQGRGRVRTTSPRDEKSFSQRGVWLAVPSARSIEE